jgi:hypothetical protein
LSCVTSLINENSFFKKEMQFTLLQNEIVATGVGWGPTVEMGNLFSCVHTQDVSLVRDKLRKNHSS